MLHRQLIENNENILEVVSFQHEVGTPNDVNPAGKSDCFRPKALIGMRDLTKSNKRLFSHLKEISKIYRP